MAISIVTDSTADIPSSLAETLGITVVPLTVFFGDKCYRDGVDLDNTSFYKKLQSSKDLPRTSQPSPAAFQEAFTRLIEEGATGILSIHLSAKLSGTYQSACTARAALPEEMKKIPIEMVDSQSVSAGITLALIKAAQEVKEGLSLEEIKAHLLDQFSRTRVFAILDTLEFLKRGGRIGAARAFLGNMLSIKPIIVVKEGQVLPVEQPRTRSKAYARVAQLIKEMGELEDIALVESNEEVGEQFAEAMKKTSRGEIPRYKLGAVLGTHSGPGTVGVALVSARK
jgi:DegV family protein with EDD domain